MKPFCYTCEEYYSNVRFEWAFLHFNTIYNVIVDIYTMEYSCFNVWIFPTYIFIKVLAIDTLHSSFKMNSLLSLLLLCSPSPLSYILL